MNYRPHSQTKVLKRQIQNTSLERYHYTMLFFL
jgi:hypothetical protein